jgi:hypothetical protein
LNILSLQAVALEVLAVAVLVVIARLFLAKTLAVERLRNLHCLLLLERLLPLLLVQVVRVLAVLLGVAQTVPILFSAQLHQQAVVAAEVLQLLQAAAVVLVAAVALLLLEPTLPGGLEHQAKALLVELVEPYSHQMKMGRAAAAALAVLVLMAHNLHRKNLVGLVVLALHLTSVALQLPEQAAAAGLLLRLERPEAQQLLAVVQGLNLAALAAL